MIHYGLRFNGNKSEFMVLTQTVGREEEELMLGEEEIKQLEVLSISLVYC